ncbi:hypothetical protein O5O45_03460 [Hahella aquimaris]|uniref:DUF6882 domain-containing protein n=1 Tax=Hahella sp. HNIBRBA332 TaxID=3015983 RepID=UPI00273AA043|nr:DUF6882 domain-containing protein [Hahella sp. HNIBRBA332]WLQ14987.1 hypothetical protein O5O45_03460 [Hahella sp. HNIBRBA332]
MEKMDYFRMDATAKVTLDSLKELYLLPQISRYQRLQTAYPCESPVEYNLYEGVARYGDTRRRIQLIGTYATGSRSFCWAWASPNPLPETVIQASLQLVAWAEAAKIESWGVIKGVCEPVEPVVVSSIAAGVLNHDYVFDVWEFTETLHGCVLVEHSDDLPKLGLHAICRVLQTALRRLSARQKTPVLEYLRQEGFKLREEGSFCYGSRFDGELTLTFDERGGVRQITPSH